MALQKWKPELPLPRPAQASHLHRANAGEYREEPAAIPRTFANKEQQDKVRALVQLMRWSGLAIVDALTLERAEIEWDKTKKVHRIVTARQKTDTHVSVPIPANSARELLAAFNGKQAARARVGQDDRAKLREVGQGTTGPAGQPRDGNLEHESKGRIGPARRSVCESNRLKT